MGTAGKEEDREREAKVGGGQAEAVATAAKEER